MQFWLYHVRPLVTKYRVKSLWANNGRKLLGLLIDRTSHYDFIPLWRFPLSLTPRVIFLHRRHLETILHQERLIILNCIELAAIILPDMPRRLRELGSHGIANTSSSVLDIVAEEQGILGKWFIIDWILVETGTGKVYSLVECWVLGDRLSLSHLNSNMI